MNYATKFSIFFLLMLLTSCFPPKEIRRMNRATRKLEKLTDKYPELLKRDTVEAEVNYIKGRTTLQFHYIDRPIPDTLYFEKEDAKVKVWKVGDTTFVNVICDTVRITDTVRIPVDRILPKEYVKMPLTWWQEMFIFLGKVFIALILILVLYVFTKNRFP
jgi:hypothetical protein